MTTYQYIRQLPRDLFEATLSGLMGLSTGSRSEQRLHTWLDEPAEKWFPPFDGAICNPVSADSMMSLIGMEASHLTPDQQAKLRRAMREYCEVCDIINQNLADRQGVNQNESA